MTRPAQTRATARLNLKLPERMRGRLDALRAQTEADTVTEVIRRALSVYDTLVTLQREEGAVVLVRTRDGQERRLLLR